ncbi:protein NRT1/ PTR FAMILY 4.4-like [Miscanthus floridulus]|uniref:protein NRT1/ PTR FAMILY 4.4-like n=1 Tax=Miscanthus floridulus TaxID=154761 RepID=UPI00345A722A
MDVESRQGSKGDAMAAAAAVSVDWRGRPCDPLKHGGMKAAVFVLGIQAFEMMAIAAVGNNLITYVFGEMHFPLSEAANIVTNFIGTVFLLSLLGGFLSDSYLGSFWTMFIFGFVELSGFILLAVQAHLPQLRPPPCDMMAAAAAGQKACEQVSSLKAGIFFAALYLVALGSGCLKPNIIAHGADQFRRGGGGGDARHLSSYFNAAYFSFCVGELVALTVLVWVQTRSGMDVGFGVSAAAMGIGMLSLVAGVAIYRNKPPQGSIFTPIAKVFVAAVSKRKQVCPSTTASVQAIAGVTVHEMSVNTTDICHINKFRLLDKACVKATDGSGKESPWRLCTPAEVEQVKLLLCVVPIFACTIVFNTILAQLQTFSVQQGSAMDTRLAASGFHVPPASLQAIPYVMLVALVPAYEAAFVPAMRRLTGVATGITPLQRIGVGLFAVTFSMVAAALVEARRRHAAAADGGGRLLSIFWIAPQFLVFGLSEMFTAVGLIEFFYKQSLAGMQAFLTSMTYCSYSFGFYFSSVLVSLVNRITSSSTSTAAGNGGWLANNDLNKDRLDLFYWLLAALSILNFFNYLFWARWYSKSVETV